MSKHYMCACLPSPLEPLFSVEHRFASVFSRRVSKDTTINDGEG